MPLVSVVQSKVERTEDYPWHWVANLIETEVFHPYIKPADMIFKSRVPFYERPRSVLQQCWIKHNHRAFESDRSLPVMPPKGRGAPKPAEFHIAYLQAGKKQWNAGESGPPVTLDGGFLGGVSRTQPWKEVRVVVNTPAAFVADNLCRQALRALAAQDKDCEGAPCGERTLVEKIFLD